MKQKVFLKNHIFIAIICIGIFLIANFTTLFVNAASPRSIQQKENKKPSSQVLTSQEAIYFSNASKDNTTNTSQDFNISPSTTPSVSNDQNIAQSTSQASSVLINSDSNVSKDSASAPIPASSYSNSIVNESSATSSASASSSKSIYKQPSSFFVDWDKSIHNLAVTKGVPTAIWLTGWGNDSQYTNEILTKSQGSIPVFVLYNIPHRDCGSYSAGGVIDRESYRSWVQGIAQSTGNRLAWFIIEPDAIANIDCLNTQLQEDRYTMISDAVSILKQNSNTQVYIDSGHANWHSASTMATRLQRANISKADGFSLNVSNFIATGISANYGKAISSLTGGKKFIIDTSRNGNGASPNGEWCNPSGRAIGAFPTQNTGDNLIAAYVWIKVPGESDGQCNGGPAAGQWWQVYAEDLIRNAGY